VRVRVRVRGRSGLGLVLVLGLELGLGLGLGRARVRGIDLDIIQPSSNPLYTVDSFDCKYKRKEDTTCSLAFTYYPSHGRPCRPCPVSFIQFHK
jgi:hypothetical protein